MSKNIVVYGKQGCSPCTTLKRMLEENKYQFEYKDIMSNLDAVDKYDIKSVPTTLIMEGDEVVKRVIGAKLEEILL